MNSVDSLVGQDSSSVKTGLVLELNILTGAGSAGDAAPGADGVLPADDRVGDEGVGLHGGLGKDSGVSQTNTSADDASLADDDVGAELSGRINLSARVNPDLAVVSTSSQRSIVVSLLNLGLDVHALAIEVVRGLANIHPVAWKLHLVKVVSSGHDREDLTLDGGGSVLDAVDNINVEQVESGVDLVADEDLGLLDESLDLSVLSCDKSNVTCLDNSSLRVVVSKGVLADNI